MVDVFIFSIGIVLGCTISYLFTKSGINIASEHLNDEDSIVMNEVTKVSKKGDIEPDIDTSLDWNAYPYTNHYNDDAVNSPNDNIDASKIIGYIDPETDEKN